MEASPPQAIRESSRQAKSAAEESRAWTRNRLGARLPGAMVAPEGGWSFLAQPPVAVGIGPGIHPGPRRPMHHPLSLPEPVKPVNGHARAVVKRRQERAEPLRRF